MTETGRSAPGMANGTGVPPSVRRTLIAQAVAVASVGCAQWGTLQSAPWGALGALLGSPLVGLWLAWRNRDRWPEQRAVDRALREHVDPGPEYRAAADQAARVQLARPRGALAIGVVIVGGLTLACVIVAAVREDLLVAVSAVPLMTAFVAGVLWHRRRDARADRWLADPPYLRDEEGP